MGVLKLKPLPFFTGMSRPQAVIYIDSALRLGAEGRARAGRAIAEQKALLSKHDYGIFIARELSITMGKAEKLIQAWKNVKPAGMYLKYIRTTALGFLCQPNMDQGTALEICALAKKGKVVTMKMAQGIWDKNHPKIPATALESRRIMRAIMILARRLPRKAIRNRLIPKLQSL